MHKASPIILQGFNWVSHKHCIQYEQSWYSYLNDNIKNIKHFNFIWLPPPSESVSDEGYLPVDLYNLNSNYGSKDELCSLLDNLNHNKIYPICDVVINHRCAKYQDSNGIYNKFGDSLPWDNSVITPNNLRWGGTGHYSTGEEYIPAPNIDHTQSTIRCDIIAWLQYLKQLGYHGWRYDFCKGYSGIYIKEYNESTTPLISIGEYWDDCDYNLDGSLHLIQDTHRQRIVNWIDSTHGSSHAFDITTRAILLEALSHNELYRLERNNQNSGVLGYWADRAITFVENHDTIHLWNFPEHLVEKAYVFILTHPGIPCVFWDHKDLHIIPKLIQLRKNFKITENSDIIFIDISKHVYHVKINDLYVIIGFYQSLPENTHILLQGHEYIIYEYLEII